MWCVAAVVDRAVSEATWLH